MPELILALDVPSAGDARRLLDRLPALRWVKVGSILMTAEGPSLVRELVARGLEVFLDLKWHDIPNTVAGSVAAAGALRVSLATVHGLGGPAMLRAAAAAAAATPGLRLVGVTVLTSHDEPDYASAVGRADVRLLDEAARLARSVVTAGLAGVVCSPLEVERIRSGLGPGPVIVVPGIRRPDDAAGDQQRTATPREAVRAGATHLVVGRPILQAADPAAALDAFLTDLS